MKMINEHNIFKVKYKEENESQEISINKLGELEHVIIINLEELSKAWCGYRFLFVHQYNAITFLFFSIFFDPPFLPVLN